MFDGLGSLIKLRQNADSVTDGHIDDQAKSFPVLESPNLFPFCAFTTIFFFFEGTIFRPRMCQQIFNYSDLCKA